MKIVVVGATDVGKTTIIQNLRGCFLENAPHSPPKGVQAEAAIPEFVEVSWPPPPIIRRRGFSSKRVNVGVIVAEPNRYSLIFLKSIYRAFSPHTPKIILMNKIDTTLRSDAAAADEIELYENFCASHGCDVLKICAFDDNSHIWDKIYKHCIV